MAKNKKLMYLLSLGGVALFAALTVIIMIPSFFLKIGSNITHSFFYESTASGFDLISGEFNELNGVKVACNAFIIISIILCALLIIAVLLRAINVIPKFSKMLSSLVISALSIALAVCAVIFIIKIGSFNSGFVLREIKCGAGAILYLIFTIFTALSAISLFFTDKKIAARKKRK